MLLWAAACVLALCSVPAAYASAAPAPDTWQLLGSGPTALRNPVEALAVDPGNPLLLLAGAQDGSIYRSSDGGAHWAPTKSHPSRAVAALTFNPGVPGQVLAGTAGAGIWVSGDSGGSWQPTPSTTAAGVRAITASAGLVAAATQHGVLLSSGGTTWTAAGLTNVDVSALTIVGGGAQPELIAGGDGELTGQPLPLYVTQNGGASWASVGSTVSGSTMVASLLTLPAGGSSPIVLLGTNGGLFKSADGGTSWAAENGGGTLPPVDISALAAGGGDGKTYYAASDGGGSSSGGLWVTRDGGSTFTSLQPPEPSVTSLTVVVGANPRIYAASFRPLDHAVLFWTYSDVGGIPQAPVQPVPTAQPNGAAAPAPVSTVNWARALSHGPETPFLAISACTVLILLLALGAYARSARRL